MNEIESEVEGSSQIYIHKDFSLNQRESQPLKDENFINHTTKYDGDQ